MIKVSIVGATGYTGEQIIKILLRHKDAKIVSLTAKLDNEVYIDDEFPELKNLIHQKCYPFEKEKAISGADLIFLALPHTLSMKFSGYFLDKGLKVIDLSADYRLKDAEVYSRWYDCRHTDSGNIEKAVYGLPELYENEIKKADFVANPGCYPTSAILGLAPVLKEGLNSGSEIIIDSKTGIMGAGRKASLAFHFPECEGSVKAYRIGAHQHTPEMEQELSKIAGKNIKVLFTPHLIPMSRGILSTIYLTLKKEVSLGKIVELYSDFYKGKPFVRVYPQGKLPQTKDIRSNNFCDIGFAYDKATGKLVIISTVDNLLKGAAGQAVQNMNIMFGLEQTEGLI